MDIRDEIRLSKDDSLPKSSSLRDFDQNKHLNKLSGVKNKPQFGRGSSKKSKVIGSDSPRILNKVLVVKDKACVDKAPDVVKDKADVVKDKLTNVVNDKADVVKESVAKDKDKVDVVKDKVN
ncbi:hypothetical protein Tco_1517289 [Tanacetum coccineum]